MNKCPLCHNMKINGEGFDHIMSRSHRSRMSKLSYIDEWWKLNTGDLNKRINLLKKNGL